VTLLVAIDGSAVSVDVLHAAAALGRATGWSLRVLQVAEAGGPVRPLPPALVEDADFQVASGDAATEIIRAAQAPEVRAIALGLRSDERPGLGHVVERVLREAGRTLLLVRPGMRRPGELRRLLVPLEGSPSTSEAMRLADDALCSRGREIVLLHVVTGDTPDEPGSLPAPRFSDQEHYEWASWQEEFSMRFSQCAHGGRHRVAVRVGEPAELILQEAAKLDAELLVVSWKQDLGEGRAARVRLLLESSPCPVLLVATPA
jgi:nucleotide-binding universal stress UspA family protein